MSTPADPRLPPITALPSLPPPTQTQVLDLLFEPSPAIHALLLPLLTIPFRSYDALVNEAHRVILPLSSSPPAPADARLHAILSSHPRLGARRLDSPQSASEQAQLAAAADELAALNAEYEARFPGLRYVVFVDGRGKDVIMEDMRRRIERGDTALEEREAIQAKNLAIGRRLTPLWAMCDIAKDRAAKLQS